MKRFLRTLADDYLLLLVRVPVSDRYSKITAFALRKQTPETVVDFSAYILFFSGRPCHTLPFFF